MKLTQISEAKPAIQANDPVGIFSELNRVVKSSRPQKFPKLDRAMLNDAIREAVIRFNKAGTGDAHDVAFPYDSDFGIATKAESVMRSMTVGKGRGGTMDISLVQNEKFKAYLDAVKVISETAAEAEAYGKLVYNLIIHIWSLMGEITRTDGHGSSDEDEKFAITTAFKALGLKVVRR